MEKANFGLKSKGKKLLNQMEKNSCLFQVLKISFYIENILIKNLYIQQIPSQSYYFILCNK